MPSVTVLKFLIIKKKKKESLYFHLALSPAYDELVERNDFDVILWGGSNQLLIQAHMILCLIWRAV